jgi:hypothetical protein
MAMQSIIGIFGRVTSNLQPVHSTIACICAHGNGFYQYGRGIWVDSVAGTTCQHPDPVIIFSTYLQSLGP